MTDRINLFVAQLPPGYDPASFYIEFGAEALQQVVSGAVPWQQWRFDAVELALLEAGDAHGYAGPTPEERVTAVYDLLPVVQALKEPILRIHYIRRLALIGDVPEAVIAGMLGEAYNGEADWRGQYRGEV